ncbi:hypothetical protein [Streptomyces sp. Qhu_M48]
MTERPEDTVRRFARRLNAVERLVGGRPGYHTVTVKQLLTAMSDADDEPFIPRTERAYWLDIADALNAAGRVGMAVGIDLDGTLTDHNAWSVVWNRETARWELAGYDDASAQDPTTADDPTPLRWGLDDVMHGDDDTVTVCLSGPAPDRRPYALELDPDRARALRTALAPPRPSSDGEAVSPEEGIDEARACIAHVLGLFLDRVPRAELEADIMADSITDAMSDELSDLYEKAGRADAAEAAVARALAWCDDLDRAVRLHHMDLDAEHPHAVALRTVIAQDGTL